MQALITLYFGVLGAIFGSFALAMVDRMKAKKDWVRGRSICSNCKKTLQPIDLIPVLSWLSTGGKCRYCKIKLSSAYPIVELGLAGAFVLSYLYFPFDLSNSGISLFVLWMGALVILMALVIFDARWFLLPNKLVYPLVYVAIAHWVIFALSNNTDYVRDVINLITALSLSAGLFLLIHTLSKGKWLGDGDVRLAVAMGLLLAEPVMVWIAIFVASVAGLIPVIPNVLKHKNIRKMKIPYGPYLILGLIVTYLFGKHAIDWYLQSFIYF